VHACGVARVLKTKRVDGWPLQDIVELLVVCARINRLFIRVKGEPHVYLPAYSNPLLFSEPWQHLRCDVQHGRLVPAANRAHRRICREVVG